MANWLGYLVFAASGFVLPRLISDNLGRDLLGIWDLAWLIVSYAGLLTLGVGGAASRYIARHRAREDWLALSAMASSCLAVLVVASVLAVGLALMMVWVTPRL
ncbi:MAG: hypothetical protein IIA66_01540, partial [Planctomycetes bacterium]|nr:hypothetical protein [Planctomycetota bacterium]